MEEKVQCPKCKSTNITADKKGYSLGKGVVGGVLLGPLGLLAGMHGKNKIELICLNCGNVFSSKPVEPQFSALPPASSTSTGSVPMFSLPKSIYGIPHNDAPLPIPMDAMCGLFILFTPILTIIIWFFSDFNFFTSLKIASIIIIIIMGIVKLVNWKERRDKTKEYLKRVEEYQKKHSWFNPHDF